MIFSGLVVGREKAKKFKIGFDARSASCGMGSNEINDAFDKLYHSGAFLLWDNVQGRIVSYGRFKTDQPIIFKMTKNNWNDIMYDVACAIMSGTPYGK